MRINVSNAGNPIRINGTEYANGLGAHANSIIEYDLPDGYITFKAFAGIDDEVSSSTEGATVEFLVFTQSPEKQTAEAISVSFADMGITDTFLVRDL